jgi:hypothetical protein
MKTPGRQPGPGKGNAGATFFILLMKESGFEDNQPARQVMDHAY